ncbi:MAG: calcium/sodium antiporter [Muribaculaceae bacterium]|nr:calcium/sodium antiporter [Muribaculaceae bacterium]
MLLDIVLLITGLALILAGANYMTDGATSLAKRMGLSDFIIGLTIVSMMTSAPELMVSITGALSASGQMAIGNIVGSNIFNILVIVGLCAIIRPIPVGRGILTGEIPLVLLSSVVLLVMGSSVWLDGAQDMILTRVDGILLLIFFIIFMRYTLNSARKNPETTTEDNSETAIKIKPLWKALTLLLGGLAALVIGGEMFVGNASSLARELGWSEGLIGLTILAAGTSLPELATSAVAAYKGSSGIALGNVIGSNIFNIFFVLGCTSTITQLPFGTINIVDLLFLTFTTLVFWAMGWWWGNRRFTRLEGVILVLLYIAYMTYLYANLPA